MSNKTRNQVDQEIEKERLLNKAKEILVLLGDETSQNAINIMNYLTQKINGKLQEEAKQKLIKDICQDDFKT